MFTSRAAHISAQCSIDFEERAERTNTLSRLISEQLIPVSHAYRHHQGNNKPTCSHYRRSDQSIDLLKMVMTLMSNLLTETEERKNSFHKIKTPTTNILVAANRKVKV